MGDLTHNPYASPSGSVERNSPPVADWRDWVAIAAMLVLAIVGVSAWYQYTFRETGDPVFARDAAILASVPYGLCLVSIAAAGSTGARIRHWTPISVAVCWICCGLSWSHYMGIGVPNPVHSHPFLVPVIGIALAIVSQGILWLEFAYRGQLLNRAPADCKKA